MVYIIHLPATLLAGFFCIKNSRRNQTPTVFSLKKILNYENSFTKLMFFILNKPNKSGFFI